MGASSLLVHAASELQQRLVGLCASAEYRTIRPSGDCDVDVKW
jgi:hypothetical protein